MRHVNIMRIDRILPLLLVAAMLVSPAWSFGGPVVIGGDDADDHGDSVQPGCLGCGSGNQEGDLCSNTCAACADGSRTDFVGGPPAPCHVYDGNQPACEQAWAVSGTGAEVSCFYDVGSDECQGCGPNNHDSGDCTNTCAGCADASQTDFLGGPPATCHVYDGFPAECAAAWTINRLGWAVSCFYDGGSCQGCGPQNSEDGDCLNTCDACDADPTRSTFAGGYPSPCRQYDADQTTCEDSWALNRDGNAVSCFFLAEAANTRGYKYIEEVFNSMKPEVTNGNTVVVCLGCNDDDAEEAFESGFDLSTLPDMGWTRETLTSLSDLEEFFDGSGAVNIDDAGIVYMPSDYDSTDGGIENDQLAIVNDNAAILAGFVEGGGGLFTHTQEDADDAFDWLTALLPGAGFLPADGFCDDETLNLTPAGQAAFPDLTDEILSNSTPWHNYFTGDFGDLQVLVTGGPCRVLGDCVDENREIFAGGPGGGPCHTFDDDPEQCEQAWALTGNGVPVPCFFNADYEECQGCGRENFADGNCEQTCLTCLDTELSFAGGPNDGRCRQFDDEPEQCEQAWVFSFDQLPVSCFYNENDEECQGCGSNNFESGNCTNTCLPFEPVPVILGGDEVVIDERPGLYFSTTDDVEFDASEQTLRKENLYKYDGEVVDLAAAFLPAHVGLDAVAVGSLFFSTNDDGFVTFPGGNITVRDENIYEKLEDGTIILAPGSENLRVRNLDALARTDEGFVISTSTRHFANGRSLRHQNAYLHEPDGTTSLYFDGRAWGLQTLDCFEIFSEDPLVIGFSVSRLQFFSTDAGSGTIRPAVMYRLDTSTGEWEPLIEGIGLLGLDACADPALGENGTLEP